MLKPKYRLLTKSELVELEKQFVFFLSAQGIDANEWSKMQQDQPMRCDEFITSFSDVIFETTLQKVEYLIKSSSAAIQSIHVQSTQLVQVAASSNDETLDLLKIDFNKKDDARKGKITIGLLTKPFQSDEKMRVVFNLMEEGFNIDDGNIYKQLCLMLAD